MILNLEIVRVDSDYCDYLRQFDNKVIKRAIKLVKCSLPPSKK